jgi:hypothetical protein
MSEINDADAARDDVIATQRKRWRFLEYLYKNSKNIPPNHLQNVLAYEVGQAIGVDEKAEAERIFRYLKEKGLIKYMSLAPGVAITELGIDAVEEALTSPDQRTSYFAPINVINITGGLHGSQIVQGDRNTQSMTVSQTDWRALAEMLPALREAVVALSSEERAVAEADIATVEAQVASPSPRVRFIRESLTSLRHVLEHAGGILVAETLKAWLRAQGWTE